MRLPFASICTLCIACCTSLFAADGVFERDIRPIFQAKCVKYHGPEKQKGGYRLDVKSIALTSGDEHAPNILPSAYVTRSRCLRYSLGKE